MTSTQINPERVRRTATGRRPTTAQPRAASVPVGVITPGQPCRNGHPESAALLWSNVRNRRLRRAATCLRRRRRRAAPDGVPRATTPSGVALVDGHGRLTVRRRAGRLANLEEALAETDPRGAGRQHRHGPHPLGHPRPARPTATPTRTATPPARSPSSTTASSRTSRRCARNWRPPASSSPATPTPRSPSIWSPRRTATARLPVTSSARCWPCCAAWRATSPWCSPTPTNRAPSSPPAAPRRWWSASATARCSSAPTSPPSSSTPATRSNSARTRPW